jgi:hypothetical protein
MYQTMNDPYDIGHHRLRCSNPEIRNILKQGESVIGSPWPIRDSPIKLKLVGTHI